MITVSPSITFAGDKDRARTFRGRALSEMAILENLMSFQELEQGVRRVQPEPGVLIECAKRFGLRSIVVLAVGGGADTSGYSEECLCNCNFSVGWIVKEQDEKLDNTARLYTVMACNYKTRYVVYDNVPASDFTVYIPGQKIVLVPYSQMQFLCCPSPVVTCGNGQGYGCCPQPSTAAITADNWRATYRIIPWNAFDIPRKVNVKRTRNGQIQ